MRQRYRTLLLLLPFGLAACATPMEKEPSLVVESFYRAASEGKYEEVRRLYARQPVIIEDTVWGNGTEPIKTSILLAPSSDELQTVMNAYTRNGTLIRVEIREVRVFGDTASCRVRKHFKDGATEDVTVELFRDRQDGKWKIAWGSSTL